MPIREEAEENLRIIRSLMERATIYRAVSAEAALGGGLLALAGASVLIYIFDPGQSLSGYARAFTVVWGLVFLLAGLCNVGFLLRAARLRGEDFFSSGMKLALRAMAPGLLSGAFFAFLLGPFSEGVFALPPFWMLCYGVALLATSHFAPRSLVVLGWCFLLAAFAGFYLQSSSAWGMPVSASLLMGLTFGGFHLIYALSAWPRRKREDNGAMP